MKTKNRKRIGSVPIAVVAALALAAFISAGLLLIPSAQPAAAQDDPDDADCTVMLSNRNLTVDPPMLGTDAEPQNNDDCSSSSSRATVAIPGNNDDDMNAADDPPNRATVWVYAKDGRIAGGNSAKVYAPDATTGADVTTTRFSWIKLVIDEGTAKGQTGSGKVIAAKLMYKNVVVTPSAGESVATLYIYYQSDPPYDAGWDHDGDGGTTDAVRNKLSEVPVATDNDGKAVVMITFLGGPVLGRDKAESASGDINTMVDDDIKPQCVTGTGDNAKNAEAAHEAVDCDALDDSANNIDYEPIPGLTDVAESRSMLVVRTESDNESIQFLLDGKSMDQTLDGSDDEATIYAVIEDASGNALPGTKVTYSFQTVPASLASELPTRNEETAKTATSEATGLTSSQVTVSDEDAIALRIDNVPDMDANDRDDDDHADAVTMVTVDDLPTGDKTYRVTVTVMAGDQKLGSVVLARAGDLDMLDAEACIKIAVGKTDANMDDGCMEDYDPKMRYGVSDPVMIHTEVTDAQGTKVTGDDISVTVTPGTAESWWNSLNCMEMNDAVMPMDDEPAVGPDDMTSPYCKDYDELEAGALMAVDRAFDAKYLDATKAFDDIPAGGEDVDENGVSMFSVKDKAPGGHYVFIVEATHTPGDKEIVKKDRVMIDVADKLDSYMIEGPAYIALDGSAMFTVSAMDKNGLAPIFDTMGDDRNDQVTVLVQPNTVVVSGLMNTSGTVGALQLKTSTGMGTFTVYAPLNAMQDQKGRIIIGSGDMQKIKSFAFGEAPPEMMAPGVPMNVMAMATSHDMITVSWESPAADGGSDITGYMVQSAYMMSDGMMSDWMDVDPAHMGMDMMYMDMGLMAETTYYYRVAAINSVGKGEYSDGTAMAMTMAENMAPMAGADIDPVMMTVGDDPMMVATMFTDANADDMLTYVVDTSDEMVATAMVDMDGMVTITAVGEGMATITVTATDMDDAYAMQTIMVTVEAADTSLQDIPDSSIGVTNNANSSITVNWMGGDNADSFIVVAAELGSDPFTYEQNVAGGAAKMATISGLNSGSNYMVIVIALQGTNFEYGVLLSVMAK